MSLRLHRRFLTSILAGTLVTAPAAIAFAQPDDEEGMEEGMEEEEEGDCLLYTSPSPRDS